MDSANLILNGAAPLPTKFDQKTKIDVSDDAKKKQFARDFESVFIHKLLDEMKNTIGDWGEEKDGASKQIDAIFWQHLALDMAEKGGLGMSEEIYKSLTDSEIKNTKTDILDESL